MIAPPTLMLACYLSLINPTESAFIYHNLPACYPPLTVSLVFYLAGSEFLFDFLGFFPIANYA